MPQRPADAGGIQSGENIMTWLKTASARLIRFGFRLLQAAASLDESWEVRRIAQLEARLDEVEQRRAQIEVAT